MLGLRSSPRKRLQLNDAREPSFNISPEKTKKVCWFKSNYVYFNMVIHCVFFLQILPSYKKQKLDGESASLPKLDLALKGLSRAQLITLLQKMASKHQEVKNVFFSLTLNNKVKT